MNWFWFALLAPIFYGTVNVVDKYLVDKKVKFPVGIIPLYGFTGLAFGLIALVISGIKPIPLFDFFLLTSAGVFLTIYSWPYLIALSSDEASSVIPLFQFVPIFALVFSYLLLGESLTTQQLVGFFLIFVGGVSFAIEKQFNRILKIRKSFWLMMLATSMYAFASVMVKKTSTSQDFWLTFIYLAFGMGLGGLVMFFSKNVRKKTLEYFNSKIVLTLITLGNLLTLIAQLSQIKAFENAPIALVNVIAGIQPLYVLLLTTSLSLWFPKLIKEDISLKIIWPKLIAILGIFVGLYFVYFS